MALRSLRQLGQMLLSLAVAVFLRYAVSGEQLVERSLRAPLEIQNIPDTLEVVGDIPSQVDVRVRGPSGTLSRVGVGDLVAVLDVRAARPGSRLFHLTTEQVRAPFGIDVAQVSPATIPIAFERAGARTVPVTPAVEGEPASGYTVGDIATEPTDVEVVGPESVLRSLTRAITEPVDVTGARSTVRESVTIGVPDSSLRLKAARTARVTVTILPLPIDRIIENVPLRIDRVTSGRTAQPAPSIVNVTVKGDRTKISGLDVNSIAATVDARGLGPGRYNLAVRVAPIQDVEILAVQPPTVSVQVR